MAAQFRDGRLVKLAENVLHHMTELRSLDLGISTKYGILTYWYITTVKSPLIYLRVSLQRVRDLLFAMSTEPFSNTLQQLHVTMCDSSIIILDTLPAPSVLPQLMHLHTFTFAQPIFSDMQIPWKTVEILTASNVMPVLQRANLAIFITINDIDRIGQSSLFTDNRRVDVQFALSLIDSHQSIELTDRVPRGSRFHPRQIVGATCVISHVPRNAESLTDASPYVGGHQSRYHVWYTLPWAFDQFFRLLHPTKCITDVKVFTPPPINSVISPSQLRTRNISENE